MMKKKSVFIVFAVLALCVAFSMTIFADEGFFKHRPAQGSPAAKAGVLCPIGGEYPNGGECDSSGRCVTGVCTSGKTAACVNGGECPNGGECDGSGRCVTGACTSVKAAACVNGGECLNGSECPHTGTSAAAPVAPAANAVVLTAAQHEAEPESHPAEPEHSSHDSKSHGRHGNHD